MNIFTGTISEKENTPKIFKIAMKCSLATINGHDNVHKHTITNSIAAFFIVMCGKTRVPVH